MSAEAQSIIDKAIDRWADVYADKPYVRALFMFMTGLIPGGTAFTDAAREIMSAGVERIRLERQRTFFDELEKGESYLTEELIQTEDFLHNFTATYAAAMRTRHREKIRQFARVLLTGVREEKLDSSEIEEIQSILEDLSPREFEILRLLKLAQDELPSDDFSSSADLSGGTGMVSEKSPDPPSYALEETYFWNDFVSIIEQRCKIPKDTFYGMLTRLSRTGLFQFYPTGGAWGGSGEVGATTPLFEEFVHWVENSAIEETNNS